MDRLWKGKNSNRGNISKTREKKKKNSRRLCKGDATPIKREKRLPCKQIEVVPSSLLFLNDVQTIGSRVLDSHHLNSSGASLYTAGSFLPSTDTRPSFFPKRDEEFLLFSPRRRSNEPGAEKKLVRRILSRTFKPRVKRSLGWKLTREERVKWVRSSRNISYIRWNGTRLCLFWEQFYQNSFF